MKNEILFEEIIEIIADVAECETSDIKANTNLAEELGLNSLMGLEVMVMIERKFKIKLKEEDLVKMKTPQDIIGLMETQYADVQ